MIGRRALSLAVGFAQLAAALVVLGLPGWAGALDFFVSPQPTVASALAASRLTASLLALAMFAWALSGAARAALGTVGRRRRQNLAGAAVLALGLLILGVGVARHLGAATVALGPGSVQEARQELAR